MFHHKYTRPHSGRHVFRVETNFTALCIIFAVGVTCIAVRSNSVLLQMRSRSRESQNAVAEAFRKGINHGQCGITSFIRGIFTLSCVIQPEYETQPDHDWLTRIRLQYLEGFKETSRFRGDVPPTKSKPFFNQKNTLPSFDDGTHLNEPTVASLTGSTADYSSCSYRSKIATSTSHTSEVHKHLKRAEFKGGVNEPDKILDDYKIKHTSNANQDSVLQNDYLTASQPDLQKSHVTKSIKGGPRSSKLDNVKEKDSSRKSKTICPAYNKPFYAVVVGNCVRVYDTKLYASLPIHNKYMVKERVHDATGNTKIKLTLKSSFSENNCNDFNLKEDTKAEDNVETDGVDEGIHWRGNCTKIGYIVYTCDRRFHGNIKYPLPNAKATTSKIGRGGNGYVFTLYHEKKQYAVKQTVYRPNEVNVHSALKHKNILPLLAVLMGEKHEHHSGRFYCYHFMPRMDYDLRQILSTKEVGCLKYLYRNCSTNLPKFDRAFSNVKYILKETLKALAYIHSNGYVHRDVKASNIMIRMNCTCNPLYCNCTSKFQVRIGDFDSAGIIPGFGIKEPTDQLIKFASILPLGTPGYRAPEVSMHIVLSGPYETLYTTAVDMWSFGCLCLNICIGKTAALKQREEASLLLSATHQCSKELWMKTTKISELEKTQPFARDISLLKLVHSCLQVDSKKRLSAVDAQAYLS